MGLKLFNTLSGELEDFVPLGDPVRIYTCGLTVQGLPHVGHMRAYIVRDILVRWLEYLGFRVEVLENFTDIDDKIIEKQIQLKKDWRMIAQDNITKYLNAIDRFNIKRAQFYPRASQHIEEIIVLVQRLLDKGFAYEKSGDVYFRVRKFPDYGKLSKKSIDDLLSGARIAPTEHKEDPLDFALWKSAKPGEPYWLSPWGKGRPGWHIECSAMSMHYLGETFDIHMGGEDLIFPHHENEIAQSVAATGKKFSCYWVHNGWVTLSGEKMAKSTGHFYLIEDLLKEYCPNVVRLYLIKTQHRTQIEFSQERLDEARAAYLRIQTYVHGFRVLPQIQKPLKHEEFCAAMNDNLNTPKALGIIYDLVSEGHEHLNAEIAASVKIYLDILGFADEIPAEPLGEVMEVLSEVTDRLTLEAKTDFLDTIKDELFEMPKVIKDMSDVFPNMVGLLLNIRNRLRKEKDYAFADHIRQRLAANCIIVDDQGMDKSTYRLEVR